MNPEQTVNTGAPNSNRKASEAGVVEAHPGIIESTNIDPLNRDSNKEDGWAGLPNTTRPDGGQAGVIEAHPGIIESTNIAPLDKTSNKDGSWVNATSRGMMNTASSMAGAASTMATGAVKATYGTATGRKDLAEEGKKEFMG